MGGSSKASTQANSTVDNSQHVLDASSNQGFAVSGISAGDKSSVNLTDQSGNEGVLLSGTIGGGKGSTTNVTLTDNGAVSSALDFAGSAGASALDFAAAMGGGALDFGNQALTAITDATAGAMSAMSSSNDKALGQVNELAQSMAQGGSQKTVLWIVGGALLVVGVVVVAVNKK